jgi:hypothetical protein
MKTGWLVWLLLATLATPARASVAIEVDDSDKALTIQGRIGDNSSFTTEVRLTSRAAIPKLVFYATDLKLQTGSGLITRDQVAVATGQNIELQRNMPVDVKLNVTGVKIPGTYTGTIEFWQPDPSVLRLPLTVVAIAPPKLTPRKGTDNIRLQFVNCVSYDCWIARLLLPASQFLSEYPLMFDNDSLAPVKVRAITVGAVGEQDQYPLTAKDLELPITTTLPLQPLVVVPLRVNRSDIPPDHYVGDVQLTLADLDTRLRLPLDLNVRTGPGLAVLVLLLGRVNK